MDWTKAKTILIIALLLTDLLLGGMYLYQDMHRKAPIENEIENTLEVLANRSIYVDAEIPERVPKMPVLFVKHSETNTDRVEQVLYEAAENRKSPMTEKDLKTLCKDLLQKCGYDFDTLVYDSCSIEGEQAVVVYKNVYDGIPVEESSVIFQIEDGKVVSMERIWLEPVGYGKMKQKITMPTDALIQFMSEEASRREENAEEEEIRIEKIDLVYWLDSSIGARDSVEDTALPAWRLTYNGGQVTFIEAYDQR